jgi:parallel beta-helix repeat protein
MLRLVRIFGLIASCSTGVSTFAASLPTSPRTYYISSTSGNDSNDGLSPNKAWQHLGMVLLKSTSKDPFQPGDKILLKRGDVWYGQIRLRANGTTDRPIVVGAYGDGPKPLIYGDDQQIRWEPVTGHKGVFSADVGNGSTLGVLYQAGQTMKIVSPPGALNRPEEIEAFLTTLQEGSSGPSSGNRVWVRTRGNEHATGSVRLFRSAGVSIFDSSDVEVENLDIRRFLTGVDVTTSTNVLIEHTDVQDVLGIGVYLRSGDRNCRVESNTVFRAGNTALYVLDGTDNTFRDNWVSHVETTVLGIPVGGDKMGAGLQQSQRTLVEYNYLAYSGGIDFYFEQGSTVRYNYLYRVRSSGAPHGVNLQVYGNIYNLGEGTAKPAATGINAVATGPGSIAVFNNTIVDAYGYSLMGSSDKGGNVRFADNIVFSAAGGRMTEFGANVSSNHNCYFSPQPITFRGNGSNFASLQEYQRATGMDGDSIIADPQFMGTAHLTPMDFRINPSSGCNSRATGGRLIPASRVRTYDQVENGEPVIGALQPGKSTSSDKAESCTVHCVGHSFKIANATYLLRLKLSAPANLSAPACRLTVVINGRKMDLGNPSPAVWKGSPLDFLVRPDGGTIVLEQVGCGQDLTIAEMEILPFDQAHGDDLQVVPW